MTGMQRAVAKLDEAEEEDEKDRGFGSFESTSSTKPVNVDLSGGDGVGVPDDTWVPSTVNNSVAEHTHRRTVDCASRRLLASCDEGRKENNVSNGRRRSAVSSRWYVLRKGMMMVETAVGGMPTAPECMLQANRPGSRWSDAGLVLVWCWSGAGRGLSGGGGGGGVAVDEQQTNVRMASGRCQGHGQ